MDQFIAEIRIFPFNFPPTGWAFCNGQILAISQNTALFSLLGTMYGGDGRSTFALPDLQGRTPMQAGQGQGLSLRDLGEMGGVESITLLQSEIPTHTHFIGSNQMLHQTVNIAMQAGGTPNTNSPVNAYFAEVPGQNQYSTTSGAGNLGGTKVELSSSVTGGSLPHNNMQPYLAMNFCIALQGIFPQRP